MKPVVPKVRVGDVLRGTKNLRNYLRLCSLLRYFKAITSGMSPNKDIQKHKALLYTPNKQTSFVVAVNSNGRFVVWSGEITLVFYNGLSEAKDLNPRMDPSIFAKWFIRTENKNPKVLNWPKHAYYLWVALQLNAWANSKYALKVTGITSVPGTEDSPFHPTEHINTLIEYDGTGAAEIARAARKAMCEGNFRIGLSDERRTGKSPLGMLPFGPTLNSIGYLQVEVKKILESHKFKAIKNKESLPVAEMATYVNSFFNNAEAISLYPQTKEN